MLLPFYPFCTLQKRPSFPLYSGQEENIPGHSVKRRAYLFLLKIAWVFPIPTGRVETGLCWITKTQLAGGWNITLNLKDFSDF